MTLRFVGASGGQPRLLSALTVLIFALAAPAFAADDDDDELPDYRPGLVATYRTAEGNRVVRRDDDVQFVWRSQSPDPRIAAGPFTARWEGRLFVMAPGKYQLRIFAQGKVRLVVAGKQVLERTTSQPQWLATEPLALDYGYHPLELDFEKSGDEARVALYWSGPQFQLEPLTERNLVHEPRVAPDESFAQGRLLARALRCEACHSGARPAERLTAPELTKLDGNLHPDWIVRWLTAAPQSKVDASGAGAAEEPIDRVSRRMPHLGLSEADGQAIAAFLLANSLPLEKPAAILSPPPSEPNPASVAKPADPTKKKSSASKSSASKAASKDKKKPSQPKPRTEPSATEGEALLDTVGCLACHQVDQRGQATLFGGGDLSAVAEKRPADFFGRWLADPATINRAHRMPVFILADLERQDLALYLATLKDKNAQPPLGGGAPPHGASAKSSELVERGRALIGQWRCGACHQLPAAAKTNFSPIPRLAASSRWDNGCLTDSAPAAQRPTYALTSPQRAALQAYYSQLPSRQPAAEPIDGRFGLAERNCVGCHARGLHPGMAGQTARLTAARPELAPLLPALSPPSLAGVGDKLHDEALDAAILLKHPPLRPWLKIRMPRFPLANDELRAIVDYFIDHDRVPPLERPAESDQHDPNVLTSGSRLVTSDGFGCTSCHKIGGSEPVQVTLAAHGTDLSLVGSRIRRPWFDRWVRNPARIVPRMEMPAIQLPVRGVLHENLAGQLSAVWTALNTTGFEPPLPNPVRVVRTRNLPDKPEPSVVLTDVMELGKKVFLRPIVIGLPNRQNILFDLETNRLAAWWLGDTARQRTRGKSWYWEAGASSVIPLPGDGGSSELCLRRNGKWFEPIEIGQCVAELSQIQHPIDSPDAIRFTYFVKFAGDNDQQSETVWIAQTFSTKSVDPAKRMVFSRRIEAGGTYSGELVWRPLFGSIRTDRFSLELPSVPGKPSAIIDSQSGGEVDHDGWVKLTSRRGDSIQGARGCYVEYRVDLPADQFPIDPVAPPPDLPAKLKIVPGYEAIRLPLARDEMPTGLDWRPDGTLVISSLKGRVCLLHDTDGDGLEDKIKPFSDDLAAPYGVNCTGDDIDVINKYGLLRLSDKNGDGRAELTDLVADGWGYTADYHDWAVGLPRDKHGNYYIALPCQQDDRSEAAARFRGWALKLVPREVSPDNPKLFAVEPLAGGLRFPMGLALNHAGDLFATDNQGNYTPYVELNQLLAGQRYGFINKLEVKPGFSPPYRQAAIDIPHPWARSTNGICFLDTPEAVRKSLGRPLFGRYEGHIIGCEYNGRSLVRMSLERIGDVYQGAVYAFSRPPSENEETFEGPVVSAVAPDGDLYVGNLRDSGWGGGQNTGSIVRLRPDGPLPPGIAEVKAARRGFDISFTQRLDRKLAADPAHWAIVSSRRIPTPAYGGNDVDVRTERIRSIKVADDGLSVRLALGEMRGGFVYEIRSSAQAADGQPLFPAEAYYTLRQLPP